MATKTEAQKRASINLRTIRLMLDDLPEVAEEWQQLNEGEQVSWSLDWDNEMSGLVSLAHCATEGVLTADQGDLYQQLVHRLRDALPTIKRLGLRMPPIQLDEKAA